MIHERAAPPHTTVESEPRATPGPSLVRFVPPDWHGALDYGAAAVLLLAPAALGLDSATPGAAELSIAAGVLLIAYSLITDYRLALSGWISLRTHLALDLAAGATLLASPFVFGFEGLDRAYLIVMGVGVFLAVAVTRTNPSEKGDRS